MQHMEELNIKYDRIYWLKSGENGNPSLPEALLKIFPDRKKPYQEIYQKQ
jgi:hypothetical protein